MKRTARFSLLAFVLATLFASSADATNSIRVIGFGAIQDSMGGASVGLPLSSGTMASNPAGMSELDGRVDFDTAFLKVNMHYQATGVGSGTEIGSDRRVSPVPGIGMVMPLNSVTRLGVGLYTIAGTGSDYAADIYGATAGIAASLIRFTPALSYKINDKVSVGATLNVNYVNMDYTAAGQAHQGATAYGYGATFGLLVKPLDFLRVGLAYETKETFQDFRFNMNPPGMDKLGFNTPQVATLGFGFIPTEDLLVGLDVEWINWSQTMGKNKPAYSFSSVGSAPFDMDWGDSWVYKFGVQYTVNPILLLRAGYNYNTSPVNTDRAFENIMFPTINQHNICAGIGVNFTSRLAVNLAGVYTPSRTITGSNLAQGIASYELKADQWQTDLGVAYSF